MLLDIRSDVIEFLAFQVQQDMARQEQMLLASPEKNMEQIIPSFYIESQSLLELLIS